ncbi:Tyrosyl-tRNA synthetase [uncultured virus]|nr:Tyrosyl-tRNA synthetase [uncultured virus]
MDLPTDEKIFLITRNLNEILGNLDDIKDILIERPLKIYWGTATTGSPHFGYFLHMLKIADYLDAGCDVTILLADLHAVLDNLKSTFEQVNFRTQYYEIIITEMLKLLKVDLTKLKFIKGSDFQLEKQYTFDMYRANTLINQNESKHAGAEVVKQSDNPTMSGLLYPILQTLDLHYLDCDVFSGGLDQRKINVFARSLLPKLGYSKGFHFMTKMVPGLSKVKNCSLDKMSASEINTKIDLLDNPNILKKKIASTYCLQGDVNDNTLIIFIEILLFPILKRLGLNFNINRPEKYGGLTVYENFENIKSDFVEKKLHPGDLKLGLLDCLVNLLKPIRDKFEETEMKDLLKLAY